jgi:hypothetical protein
MVDDERMPEALRQTAKKEMVRFRTLGCYPLTGAINSTATTLPSVFSKPNTGVLPAAPLPLLPLILFAPK